MFYVFLAEGFEETEALAPVDVMRRAKLDVKTVGVTGECVTSSHGVPVKADITIDSIDLDGVQGVVLPGGMPGTLNLEANEKVLEAVKYSCENGKIVAAICAAPSILGHLGILDGKKATCFPGFEKELKGADYTGTHTVTDGNIITAKGAGCAIEFGHAKYKKIRKSCPPEKKQQLDLALQNAFLASEEYKSCDVLFAFASSPIEVDTSLILETTLKDGKKLALPRCRNNFGEMDFYLVTSLSQLEKGAFSIMEPNPEVCEKYEDFSHGLCLVPGLCFDTQGFRLGFGKGYYDRFLQSFSGTSVGLCYSKCMEHTLPSGVFDRPVDAVITEKYTNRTNNEFVKE